MIALIQRVTEASVTINHVRTAEIEAGLLALIGVEQSDSEASAVRLAERVMRYRVFSDDAGRMNLDVLEAGLGVLAVPQFTLVADTQKGRRPGFSRAAPPDQASALFDHFADTLQASLQHFGRGTFGANMAVSLVNDGPVTFWLQAD